MLLGQIGSRPAGAEGQIRTDVSFRFRFTRAVHSTSMRLQQINGGEGGIWTLATCYRPTPLAGEPLRPLEYFSVAGVVGFEPTNVRVKAAYVNHFIIPQYKNPTTAID